MVVLILFSHPECDMLKFVSNKKKIKKNINLLRIWFSSSIYVERLLSEEF